MIYLVALILYWVSLGRIRWVCYLDQKACHKYAVSHEAIVTTQEEARWKVIQKDGSIRWVAENLFARDGDIAEWVGPPTR